MVECELINGTDIPEEVKLLWISQLTEYSKSTCMSCQGRNPGLPCLSQTLSQLSYHNRHGSLLFFPKMCTNLILTYKSSQTVPHSLL